MPKVSIYLPDDLAARVKATEMNVSAVCQQALSLEVQRMEAVAERAQDFERIEVEVGDGDRGFHTEAFTGRWLVQDRDATEQDYEDGLIGGSSAVSIALTRRGRIAVYLDAGTDGSSLLVYGSLNEIEPSEIPASVVAEARAELTGAAVERDI